MMVEKSYSAFLLQKEQVGRDDTRASVVMIFWFEWDWGLNRLGGRLEVVGKGRGVSGLGLGLGETPVAMVLFVFVEEHQHLLPAKASPRSICPSRYTVSISRMERLMSFLGAGRGGITFMRGLG